MMTSLGETSGTSLGVVIGVPFELRADGQARRHARLAALIRRQLAELLRAAARRREQHHERERARNQHPNDANGT